MRPSLVFSLLLLLLSLAFSQSVVPAPALIARRRFITQCINQQKLLPPLLRAIAARDLSASRRAYIAARPPYEQIETLANVFPLLDRDIDARPYVFNDGEFNPKWKGFHRIERALFRDSRFHDNRTPPLVQLSTVARQLNRSVNTLCALLRRGRGYTPAAIMEGSVALAFEVPAKKVASEEETWSQLSLMIFRNNWRGVWSQIQPFLTTVPKPTANLMRRAYRNVQNVYNKIDRKNGFFTTAGTARSYRTVSTAQRRMLIRAGYQFARAVEGVQRAVIKNGAESDEEEAEEKVSTAEKGMYRAQLNSGLRIYANYCREQQRSLTFLLKTINSGNLIAARRVYARARLPYERIEVLAADFPTLDRNIDGRPYALPRGELDRDWRGFHKVERALFRDAQLGVASNATRRLSRDVRALCRTLNRGANQGGGTFSTRRAFDGMATLAYEVSAKKISSEEEHWSDLSIMIFRENSKGIQALLAPYLPALSPQKRRAIRMALRRVRDVVGRVVDSANEWNTGVRFRKYSDVKVWERRDITQAFYALARSVEEARDALLSKK